MSAKLPSVLKRVTLTLAAAGVILAVAVYQGNALIGRSQSAYRVASGPSVVEPVPGSRFLRSYPATVNGETVEFGHYASDLSAEEVVRAFARRYEQAVSADSEAPSRKAPMLLSAGSGCSTFSYARRDGSVIGIIAYDQQEGAGSHYVVGATAAGAAGRRGEGDCPGREPPGVPKPLRSTRTLCIENLGGLPSVLACYEAWGRPSEIVADTREQMTANHWLERTESSQTLTENYEGTALLSFSRGHEQCLVAVDRDPKSGKILILVFWAERRWLPKGTAL